MKKYLSSIFTLLVTAFMGLSLVACSEDDLDTNQYKGGVTLNAWGANPVMRGGVLRFVGSNLDQIKQIEIPGCSPITNIDKVKSGVPSEIRITVPKDGPVVGFVKLISNTDAEIQTTTMLEYTEPIEFTGFAPATVMPGDVLTITGDYLDHIGSLAFTGGTVIPDSSFVEHSRYTIKVVVPETAKTGRIELYDVNIMAEGFDATQTVYNIMPSEEILNVGLPSISKMKARNEADLQGTITAKAGEQVTITGNYLKLISAIKTGDVETELNEPYEFTEFTCNDEGTQITFNLPAEAPDGSINLVTKSGVEVPVGQLVTVAPTEVTVAPNPVKNGQTLTISGKDLDVVSSVIFPNSEAIEITSAAEIKVVVPETAQDGDIVLMMKNGKKLNAAYKLVQPAVTKYSANPVSAGGALSIEGTDLDLVKTVTFNGSETPVEVKAENDGKLINLVVPMDAQSGKVTFNLKNGADVTVAEIKVEEAVFCYITQFPGEDVEIKAGGTMTVQAKNMDKLTAVEVNGVNAQFIVSGENLIIGIPETTPAAAKIKLISSNGQISYDLTIIPATDVTLKLFQGMTLLDWGDNMATVSADKFADIPEGAVMVVTYTINPELNSGNAWTQLAMIGIGWSHEYSFSTESGYHFDRNYVASDEIGDSFWSMTSYDNLEARIVLDAANLEILKQKGLAICGGNANTFVTSIKVNYQISLETSINGDCVSQADQSAAWVFPNKMTWDDNGRFRILRNGASDIQNMNLKPGKTVMRIYKSGTGQVQVNNPSWSAILTVADWAGDVNPLVVEFNQAIIDCFTGKTSDGWSNTALILQGDGLTIEKITIE